MSNFSRRDFLKGTAAAGAAALASGLAGRAFAAGSDSLKVGVIGCGGRGGGAAGDCAKSSPGVQIWAAGDIFPEKTGGIAKAHNVPAARCFSGFDAYKKVIASGVDMIILATPPGFRPIHFEAAVEAGKHIFCEKPVCVDPVGYRRFAAAAEKSVQKKLCVVAGTQRRHQNGYVDVMKRIRDGALGDIVSGQCYWISGGVHHRGEQKSGMSDIEFQIRNWYNWTWICGDHIVEQHVHNIDIINWAMDAVPVKAIAVGGRSCREEKGNIYDHFAVEFEYPNNVRVASYCAHIDKGVQRVAEQVEGTKGKSNCARWIDGENKYDFKGQDGAPYVQEHTDLIAAIRGKAPYVNEAKRVADSTMCAVLGRMAAYTGREVSWKWATETSKLDLSPPKYEFTSFAPPPLAVPGKTELI